jgi:hypothetical protein
MGQAAGPGPAASPGSTRNHTSTPCRATRSRDDHGSSEVGRRAWFPLSYWHLDHRRPLLRRQPLQSRSQNVRIAARIRIAEALRFGRSAALGGNSGRLQEAPSRCGLRAREPRWLELSPGQRPPTRGSRQIRAARWRQAGRGWSVRVLTSEVSQGRERRAASEEGTAAGRRARQRSTGRNVGPFAGNGRPASHEPPISARAPGLTVDRDSPGGGRPGSSIPRGVV